MAGNTRPTIVAPPRKKAMPPPPRPSTVRSQSALPYSRFDRPGATSPAESATSVSTVSAGTKRKERDFEHDEETNINVVVRCRGRNEREVRENSGVVLSTDGVKGKSLELSMGPSALSNKTYHFDKVFSSAADQSMIYDDVVTPILDEMLAGYNCTIFAYGQTGTGKTYTMSGDMSDHFGLLSDAAGIIPRALHALFTKLELDDAESSVKVSFIELYNEELRDLISPDDALKLKIYEDNSKKGHSSTMVQGMEESYIKSAGEGVKILQHGSLKRQVAATKCNDLSSRSHTVFTVTVYIKRAAENGEDYVSAGKLNLVDLAGSENIQRSGAENKRAAEAGLINKSLLTLGRVINALVERSSRDVHIPYRESKLTRLLQDSLGGQTKTCIIATVSPAKSNLEETISTLDYAFRAKNIRNKPQVNQKVNKKTLLTEFTNEIEKLKNELIATRQRNGVYLSNEGYEEMTTQSESRKILTEEQAAKIETMESNLRNKVQELFSLTSNFMTLKKEHEGTKTLLDDTKTVLEQTEFVLANTRQTLEGETMLREAHQYTEEQLKSVGSELISTLSKTVNDVGGLHAKNKRKSDLHSLNRNAWAASQAQIREVTELVEMKVDDFKDQQRSLTDSMTVKMQNFVSDELAKLSSTQQVLEEKSSALVDSEAELSAQTKATKEEMDIVLEDIKTLREDLKGRVGEGLQGLSVTAERISAEVISELGAFNTQLHGSYSSLGRDFKSLFEDLLKHISTQKAEVNQLRQQLSAASEAAVQSNAAISIQLNNMLRVEREQGAVDRQNLLSQITDLVMKQGATQDQRLEEKISAVQQTIVSSGEAFESSRVQYGQGMDAWNENESKLVEDVLRSREMMKSKLKDDWVAANKHNASLQSTSKAVHSETCRLVDEQMKDVASQMDALDDFVTRGRSQNAQHHDRRTASLQGLVNSAQSSYTDIGSHFASTFERVKQLSSDMSEGHMSCQMNLQAACEAVRQPLTNLRVDVMNRTLEEYEPTGQTPQKVSYFYPTDLPRTSDHSTLLAALRGGPAAYRISASPSKSSTIVFNDNIESKPSSSRQTSPNSDMRPSPAGGLREIDVNISAGNPAATATTLSDSVTSASASSGDPSIIANIDLSGTTSISLPQIPTFKRSLTGSGRIPMAAKSSKKGLVVALEGGENVPPSNVVLGQSTGRRRSPRIA